MIYAIVFCLTVAVVLMVYELAFADGYYSHAPRPDTIMVHPTTYDRMVAERAGRGVGDFFGAIGAVAGGFAGAVVDAWGKSIADYGPGIKRR